jgi:hypothetical protein
MRKSFIGTNNKKAAMEDPLLNKVSMMDGFDIKGKASSGSNHLTILFVF